MSCYTDMSEQARFYLDNHDEIELAEMVASSAARVEQLQAIVDRVRALHVPSTELYYGIPACEGCEGSDPWTTPGYPCPTITALEPPKETPDA